MKELLETAMAAVILLLGLVAILYHETAYELIRDWFTDEDSYGLVLVGWAAYLVVTRRGVLSSLSRSIWWPGIAVMALALVLFFFGQITVEFYTQRISLMLLLAGVLSFHLGKRPMKLLLFPILLLFLAVPFPAVFVNHFTFPLKSAVSYLSENVFSLLAIPVFREGNILRLPNLTLEVVNACSGIRSIFALAAVGLIMSRQLEPVNRKIILLLFVVPVAVLTNVLRITITGTVHWMGFSGSVFEFFHGFGGWFFFMLALFLMWVFKNLFSRAVTDAGCQVSGVGKIGP